MLLKIITVIHKEKQKEKTKWLSRKHWQAALGISIRLDKVRLGKNYDSETNY